MKRLFALICSLAVFSAAFSMQTGIVRVKAQYTQTDLENAISTAADWTKANINPLGSAGTDASDISVTALKRAGISYDYDAYLNELDSVAENYNDSSSTMSMQLSLMAVEALGGDSGYFGGRDLAGDATYNRSLNSVGDYIGALTALDAGNTQLPEDAPVSRDDYIAKILSYQLPDGSFGSVGETAGAVIALSDYYNDTDVTYPDAEGESTVSCQDAVDQAMSYLSSQQNDSGDFYTLTDTALVSLAMDSLGVGQQDERFVKNGNTVMDGLLTYQMPDGGFSQDYNGTDETATAFALSALVSNTRQMQSKAEYFDFESGDAITISPNGSNTQSNSTSSSSGSSSSNSSSGTRATPRPSSSSSSSTRATARPSSTRRPSAQTSPRPTRTPSASPIPKITPNPTKKPALVGPAQIVGPIPTPSPEPELDDDFNMINRPDAGIPAAEAIIGVFAVAVLALVVMAKKKLWVFKETKKKEEEIKAKRHRRTEEHRRFEERRKFESRKRYTERGKYKAGRR